MTVDRGMGRVICRDTFTVEGFAAALAAILAHVDFRSGMPCLWDSRDTTNIGDLSGSDIRQIGVIMAANASRRGSGKTAVVVSGDLGFGMARMYELVTEGDRANTFRVFRDMEQARTWLGVEESCV